MNQNNRADRRIKHRMGIELKCSLSNSSDSFETQTVDISKMGLGVETDRILSLKIGDELTVWVPHLRNYSSKAKLIYTMKDLNNITRLGLKLSTSIIG